MSFLSPWLRSHNVAAASNLLVRLLLGCLFLSLAVLPAQAQPPQETLVIAISNDFHPFTFLNAEGKPAGMFVDIWRLWGTKTGKQVEFIASDWATSLENLKNGRADIHSGLIYSSDRSRWLSDSRPFYETDVRAFLSGKYGTAVNLGNFAGETLAVVRGVQIQQFMAEKYPQIRVELCATREDLVRLSLAGKVKGFVAISPVGSALIDRLGVSGEFEKSSEILYNEDIHPGVLKEKMGLNALVENGMSAISMREFATIESRWIEDPAKRHFKTENLLQLTPAEELWRKAHPTIRVGMSPVLPPLKFSENGIIKGVEPDFLKELARRTGLKFEFVVCPFAEMDAKVKADELDMFLSFNIPERTSFMSFTEPFMDFKQIIIGRNDLPFVGGLTALKGLRVATIKGVKLHEKILQPYPEIQQVPYATMEEAFQAVVEGDADALLSKTLFAGYLLEKYPQLKIAGVLDLPPEPYLYAVRKDYPELVGILNKTIAAIPIEKKDAITQKWISVHLDYRPNWSEIRDWVVAGGGGVALLLGLTFYWNRRLAREIGRQQEMAKALRMSESRLQVTFETSEAGIIQVTPQGIVEFANRRAAQMFGTTLADFVGTLYSDYLYETEKETGREIMEQLIQGELSIVGLDRHYRRKDGTDFWGHLSGNRLEDEGGVLIALVGVISDITERKNLEEALFINHEQMQFVLQGSQLGFWDWNIVTGKVERNERWAAMLGYTLAEVELNVKQWTDLIHPEDRERAWKSIQDHLEGRTPCHAIEYRMRTKDGRFLWIFDQARIVARAADNQPQRMTGTHTDITERKLTEQFRMRVQVESEERSRMARELHDGSGQSLQAIRLHLQLLAAGKGSGDLHGELGELARSVGETASELRDMSHQLRPSYLQEVNLDIAILDRCNLLTRHGVPVRLDYTGDFSALPDLLNDYFYRVFQEALSNAVQHAGAKGIKIDLTRSESCLTLCVTDDGHGIDAGRSGHGVGLQIMQERASLIGATLTIASNASGTSVTLTQENV